ncbi:hypothetical protein [Bacillus cereus group sp. BfR-BA-01317]|uniref:hypothetical protein n=1 Tax=Bacillus cereus group sp. BfR-BA-01317 TaxID=2920294 RepID=UPI001F58288E|nr:hypothetical protein [Bacillus cereus group sp. BfR-BA-01317]
MNTLKIISGLINQAMDTLLVIAGFLLFCMIVIGPLFYLLPLYKKYIKNREVDTVKRILIVKEYVAKRFGVEKESIIVESLEKKSTSKLIGFYEYMTKKEEVFRVFCEHGEFIFKMDIYDGEALLTDVKMISDTNFKDELQRLSN